MPSSCPSLDEFNVLRELHTATAITIQVWMATIEQFQGWKAKVCKVTQDPKNDWGGVDFMDLSLAIAPSLGRKGEKGLIYKGTHNEVFYHLRFLSDRRLMRYRPQHSEAPDNPVFFTSTLAEDIYNKAQSLGLMPFILSPYFKESHTWKALIVLASLGQVYKQAMPDLESSTGLNERLIRGAFKIIEKGFTVRHLTASRTFPPTKMQMEDGCHKLDRDYLQALQEEEDDAVSLDETALLRDQLLNRKPAAVVPLPLEFVTPKVAADLRDKMEPPRVGDVPPHPIVGIYPPWLTPSPHFVQLVEAEARHQKCSPQTLMDHILGEVSTNLEKSVFKWEEEKKKAAEKAAAIQAVRAELDDLDLQRQEKLRKLAELSKSSADEIVEPSGNGSKVGTVETDDVGVIDKGSHVPGPGGHQNKTSGSVG